MDSPKLDLIVIGAGLSGIAFSRFYLDTHPACQLIILEEDACVGGVWSASRLYNEFWSQSGVRMAGFADVPLILPPEAKRYYDIFESKYVTRYLEDYVDNHVYQGQTIRDRITFGFKVLEVKKIAAIWKVFSKSTTFTSSKLVIATGHTSAPSMPLLPNQRAFKGSVLHQKDFGGASRMSLTSPTNVAILGGGKSAADMVYESVKAGKSVSWIIRATGEGPAAFAPAAGIGPYKNGPEMAATRMISALSPSCFAPITWWTKLMHGSTYGRNMITKIWQGADRANHKLANYKGREGALPGFEKLETSTVVFWCTGPLGLIQHDDFWETISKNVVIYRSDIKTMQENSIILEDGSEVATDVLFCGTGWSPDYPFLTKSQVVDFGLPHHPDDDTVEESTRWDLLLKAADEQVLTNFPQLASPPPHLKRSTRTTTSRLYNCIAPLRDNTIAFVGNIYLSNSFRTAEAQAIWVTALFDGKVQLPPQKQAEEEIAYMNAFSKRRYPSHGATGNYFHMDLVGYTDKLLGDVGLESHRKGWWWQDLAYPCLASDLKGMREEYLSKSGSK